MTEDRLLAGRLILRQPARGHRAGTDAVLLAAAAGPAEGLVVDAGAGVGTVGLAVALAHPGARVALVEKDEATAGLAAQNTALNGLAGRVTVHVCDLTRGAARRGGGLMEGSAEMVLTNPPFYESGTVRASPDMRRETAHVLTDLARWIRACLALLAPGGRFVMIHRPPALPGLFEAIGGRLGDLAILPVLPRGNEAAARLLVAGRKGSRAPLRLLAPLVLHDEAGHFTARAAAIHRGEATIGL